MQALIRLTARVSLVFFLVGFAGEAAARRRPALAWLERRRRTALVALAVSHTLHLSFIVWMNVLTGGAHLTRTAVALNVVFGGTAYACIYALAIRGGKSAAESGRATRWESFAFYYIWTIFALGNFGRAVGGSALHVVAAAALAIALVLRVATRQPRAGTAGAG